MSRTTNLSPVAVRGRYAPARSRRLRLGVLMIAVAVAGSLFASPFGAARAQEADATAQPLPIKKQAYWSRSLGNVAPPSVTNNFPPSVVCLVWPDSAPTHICGGPLAHGQGLDNAVKAAQPEDHIPGSEPLAEFMAGGTDTLPTGVLAGARRYLSAIEFDLPQVPEGEKVSKFEVHLTPVDDDRLNFHFDSPAFRQAVVAALVLIGARRDDPETFQKDFEKFQDEAGKVPERDPMSEDFLGVEACPILVDWESGGNQDGKTAPDRDAIERTPDNETLDPEVDCLLGANGKLVDGTWVFDLSLAANAWAEGDIPNKGVVLRPVLPPNLAYGDPDLSTWDQVTFNSAKTTDDQSAQPAFVFQTEEKATPVSLGGARSFEPTVLGASTETFTETFGSIEQPEIADRPAPVAEGQREQAAPAVLSGDAVTEWWVWLLLPLFLGGIFLTTQALTTEPALAGVEDRSGAMTRLIEARRRGELR